LAKKWGTSIGKSVTAINARMLGGWEARVVISYTLYVIRIRGKRAWMLDGRDAGKWGGRKAIKLEG